MDCSGEFTVVRSKKSARITRNVKKQPAEARSETVDYDYALQKIFDAEREMRTSPYFQELCVVFRNSLLQTAAEPIKQIVCYGLGKISSCPTARYQLALLLCLRPLLNPECSEVYDPVFTDVERKLLESLGFSVISLNEEGKRRVARRTLFYMPHCGKPLYNSVLWANWDRLALRNVVILGNSFSNIWTTHLGKHLSDRVSYLVKVKPALKEFPIRNAFRYSDIFNDQSLHLFDEQLLSAEDLSQCDEPCYGDEDEIILSRESSRT